MEGWPGLRACAVLFHVMPPENVRRQWRKLAAVRSGVNPVVHFALVWAPLYDFFAARSGD